VTGVNKINIAKLPELVKRPQYLHAKSRLSLLKKRNSTTLKFRHPAHPGNVGKNSF
jgi:hypothetical protein